MKNPLSCLSHNIPPGLSNDGNVDLQAEVRDGMAYWNTVFVEVPITTFNPVKTVNDLLKPAHQAVGH